MKSMKMDKKQMKEMAEPVELENPEYPYGLRLHLDKETLKKLGIEKMPEPGKALMLCAKAEVTEASESASQGDKEPYRSMTLQITDMELTAEPEKKDAAKVFYGE